MHIEPSFSIKSKTKIVWYAASTEFCKVEPNIKKLGG